MSHNHLPGIDPDTDLEPSAATVSGGLPYVSKSRIKTWQQCPRKFYWKYWCDERPPGTYYTERGTQVHETFENFHLNLIEYIAEYDRRPDRFTPLLEDWQNYGQWTEMVGNFFRFEERRWKAALQSLVDDRFEHDLDDSVLNRWEPVEVEAEAWLGKPPEDWQDSADYVSGEPPVGDLPWMGRADLVADTRSVPGVSGNGVTIIDYKTGSVPDEQYRDKGIYLEGEYYGRLFETFYDVDAVAGYYPSADELITSPYPNRARYTDIERAVLGMQQAPDIENYPVEQTPLCHYNNSQNEGQCWFHPICETRHDCRHCETDQDGGDTAPRYQQ